MTRIWTSAAALAVAVGLGWGWIQLRPGAAGAQIDAGQTEARRATQPPGAALAGVVAPADFSAQARIGETYFNAVCAACHGANAAGQDGVGPPLVHRIYEPSHHGDMAFVLAAQNGVRAHHWPFGDMPALADPLTSGEMAAIIAYVRELQRANGVE